MNVMWKAACAAVLIAVLGIEIGCGGQYRPVATPNPVTTGNGSASETEVVLNQMPAGVTGNSVLTSINVSGDTNTGNKSLGTVASTIAFGANRTTVFSANTETDSVSQALVSASSAGFSANVNTIALPAGSAPSGFTFQIFGSNYTQNFVINSKPNAVCPTSGSLSAISQTSNVVTATACVGPSPVSAWIYKDHSKVFVLDNNGTVYVTSASKYKVTNTIPVGATPIKATQSADGTYVYVLNRGSRSISIIDGLAETVDPTTGTVSTSNSICGSLCDADPIDIAQDLQVNDALGTVNYNHLWVLHANGTVSVYDATNPGTLTWITSVATGPNPTNLAVMRDGTQAYVGLGGTDQIVAIDASRLSNGAVSSGVTTNISVGIHRSVTKPFTDASGATRNLPVETTTPTVNWVAVSRQGDSADLSKAYATTTTSTTYFYYDANLNQTSTAVFPNLYNGTAVVSSQAIGLTPRNTYITTILAPSQVTYCDPGTQGGAYDAQKVCPVMVPVLILGRS